MHTYPWPLDKTAVIAGVMSGTSCDGVDVAVCEITGSGLWADLRVLRAETHEFEDLFAAVRSERGAKWGEIAKGRFGAEIALRDWIIRASLPENASSPLVAELDFELGWVFGEAVRRTAGDTKLDLVASHGHTVAHYPYGGPERGVRCTRQIGNPAVIAEALGVPVVSDFRSRDVAAGGEGAPLIPYVDRVLFSGPGAPARALVNIGGIANVTYLPPGGEGDVLGFDTGPGNLVINEAARRARPELTYDVDGDLARRGKARPEALEHLLGCEYFTLKPPKSTGREEFGERWVSNIWGSGMAKGKDLVALLTELVAVTIVNAIRDYLPPVEEILLCGGGANNPTLVSRIEHHAGRSVGRVDDLGTPSEFKEAAGFALLGSETMRGVPSNVPTATGAAGPRVLGSVTFP